MKLKITEEQYTKILEGLKSDVEETHIESEPFTKYSDKKQESMAHGKEHKKKGFKNPHLKKSEVSEQFDDDDIDDDDIRDVRGSLTKFEENEIGLLDMDESDFDLALQEAKENGLGRVRMVGAIIYDAMIPNYGDEEYQRKMMQTLMEIEKKKMSNQETWLDDEIIVRGKLYK